MLDKLMQGLNERGGVLLNSESGMQAYLPLEEGVCNEPNFPYLRLEISYRPENYPALNVKAIKITNEALAAHINENFGDWFAHKLNCPGVTVDSNGYVEGIG